MEKHEVRQRLLEAVKTIYAKEEYSAVSLNRIVQEAGVSKGSVYWYFESKEDLFDAAFEECYQFCVQSTFSFDRTGMTPVEILKKRLLCMMESRTQNPITWKVMNKHLNYLSQVQGKNLFPYRGFKDDVNALVRAGIEAGEFADLPEDFINHYFFTMNSATANYFRDHPEKCDPDTVDTVVNAMLRAVLKPQ